VFTNNFKLIDLILKLDNTLKFFLELTLFFFKKEYFYGKSVKLNGSNLRMSKRTNTASKKNGDLYIAQNQTICSSNKNSNAFPLNRTQELISQCLNKTIKAEDLIADELKILEINPTYDPDTLCHEIRLKLSSMMDKNASVDSIFLGYLLLTNILLGYQIAILHNSLQINKGKF